MVLAPPPCVQDATRVGPVLLVEQVTKLGPLELGTQDATGTSFCSTGVQVVVTAFEVPALQLAGSTGVGAMTWLSRQLVVVQPLVDEAAIAVHEPLTVQADVLVLQLVVVKPLLVVGEAPVQLCTGVADCTLLGVQVVTTVPLVPAVHEATAVGPVVTVLQVVSVQLLAEVGPEAVQEATPVGPVLAVLQVVVVQLLDASADAGVHEATGTLVVVAVPQLLLV